jgi:hypothetical protein
MARKNLVLNISDVNCSAEKSNGKIDRLLGATVGLEFVANNGM